MSLLCLKLEKRWFKSDFAGLILEPFSAFPWFRISSNHNQLQPRLYLTIWLLIAWCEQVAVLEIFHLPSGKAKK